MIDCDESILERVYFAGSPRERTLNLVNRPSTKRNKLIFRPDATATGYADVRRCSHDDERKDTYLLKTLPEK